MISIIPSFEGAMASSGVGLQNNAALSAEEKERKQIEELTKRAFTLQRKQRLEAMIQKRKTNFAYLKKIHVGGSYWLNVALFTTNDVKNYVRKHVSRDRVESFFNLGLSISKILEVPSGSSTVRAFSQLMEEWEYFHSTGAAMQSVKFVMAKNSTCIYPQTIPVDGFINDLTRPSIYKFNNVIVYEYLEVPHIPFELDYVEVLLALCDSLTALYEKLLEEECYKNILIYDAIVRLDTKIKHYIVNLIAKELTEASNSKLKKETNILRGLSNAIVYTFNSNNSTSLF
eukprot:gene9417-12683_t